MATIEENLILLKNTKSSIKQSIINKGVEVSDSDSFASYANKINEIENNINLQEKTISISQNGQSSVTPDNGYNGLSKVDINVAVPIPQLQSKNYSIVTNGDTVISPDSGFGGISGGTISVNVPTSSSGNRIKVLTDILLFNNKIEQLSDAYDFSDVIYVFNIKNNSTISTTNNNNGFTDCTKLLNVNTDFNDLVQGSSMFSGCTSLQSFNGNLPQLNNGTSMFKECTSLSSWNIDLPNLTSGSSMFYNCTSLTSFNGNLSSLTGGTSMFYNCSGLTTWNIDLPALTDGSTMFSNCSGLTSFNGNLSSLVTGSTIFSDCINLQTFTSDLSSLSSDINMFLYCTALENFTLTGTLNCNNFTLSYCNNLTVDSLVNIISVLVDLTGQSSKTLILGSTNLAKLTDEQKAVATNKNWTLS